VGLVTGACFADLGNPVTCIDVNAEKIEALRQGTIPFYEPGLEDVVRRNVGAGRLSFTTSYSEGLKGAELVFIAVNTPPGLSGEADLSYVRAAFSSTIDHLRSPAIIVGKSTMPIGTGDRANRFLTDNDGVRHAIVSNPEFLREGSAVSDFMQPDRVVIGSDDRVAADRVAELYEPLGAPILITSLRTAEMIKYASNAFLATKISFINEIASICEKMGADVVQVADGMGLDRRIGRAFLNAGAGYGGSCFPKDVQALAHMAALAGSHPQLLRTVMEINHDARLNIVQKVRAALGPLESKSIGILGLAFKPETDDLREAPAIEIIHLLLAEGARVKAYDPVAMAKAAPILPCLDLCQDPYAVAEGVDALVLVTEWREFSDLDLPRLRALMAHPIFVDGRNLYDPDEMVAAGFRYVGVGRGEAHRAPRDSPLDAATARL
jgi:UDPglucose 6-dehydrogenase